MRIQVREDPGVYQSKKLFGFFLTKPVLFLFLTWCQAPGCSPRFKGLGFVALSSFTEKREGCGVLQPQRQISSVILEEIKRLL